MKPMRYYQMSIYSWHLIGLCGVVFTLVLYFTSRPGYVLSTKLEAVAMRLVKDEVRTFGEVTRSIESAVGSTGGGLRIIFESPELENKLIRMRHLGKGNAYIHLHAYCRETQTKIVILNHDLVRIEMR